MTATNLIVQVSVSISKQIASIAGRVEMHVILKKSVKTENASFHVLPKRKSVGILVWICNPMPSIVVVVGMLVLPKKRALVGCVS